MRFGGLVERGGAVDDRSDPAVGQVGAEAFEEGVDDAALLPDGPGAQGGAMDAGAAPHQSRQVEVGATAALQPDHHKAASGGEHLEVAVQVGRADAIEHDVGAAVVGELAGNGDEVLLAIVHGGIGAELSTLAAPLVGSGGDHDARARGFHELDRRRADAARAAVHQRGGAGLQPADEEEVEEGGDEDLGHAAGLGVGESLRTRHHAAGRDHHLLGVAAAGEQRHDAVAEGEAFDAVADLGDRAGALEAEDLGSARGWGIEAPPLQQVGAVDPRGCNADPNLAQTAGGVWDLGHP